MSDWRNEVDGYGKEVGWTLGRVFTKAVLPFGLFCLAAWLLMTTCGVIGGTVQETARVAREEFGPRALLEKYEWFKDASAALDKKRADVRVMEERIASLEADYAGKSRSEWPRDDREQSNVWRSEVAGVRLSYNALAADYNAQMSKFNWRFCNRGDLPPGATEPLPREYKPYDVGGGQ